MKSRTIHSLSQALGTGVLFLVLQLKEYTAAFFTLSDSIFGSNFYGTTCLHGLHVTTGSLGFGILWCSLNKDKGYKEVHLYLKFWAYYWHLVDLIWISLFILLYLRIIHWIVFYLIWISLFILLYLRIIHWISLYTPSQQMELWLRNSEIHKTRLVRSIVVTYVNNDINITLCFIQIKVVNSWLFYRRWFLP